MVPATGHWGEVLIGAVQYVYSDVIGSTWRQAAEPRQNSNSQCTVGIFSVGGTSGLILLVGAHAKIDVRHYAGEVGGRPLECKR